MQVPLEKRYGFRAAVLVTSLTFLLLHLNQAWAPPLLLHIYALGALLGILAYATGSLIPGIIAHVIMDVVNFAYWWSDVAGRFEMQTLAEAGVDFHFIGSILVLGVSVALFFLAVRRVIAVRHRI
jgi:membrane protease YdiL (CAAX protease family)